MLHKCEGDCTPLGKVSLWLVCSGLAGSHSNQFLSWKRKHLRWPSFNEDRAIKQPLVFSCGNTTHCDWAPVMTAEILLSEYLIYYFLKWGNGGIFLYHFSSALTPCNVWNKTKTQLVALCLWDQQRVGCGSGHCPGPPDCIVVRSSFWRFINLVLEKAYHRKCLVLATSSLAMICWIMTP